MIINNLDINDDIFKEFISKFNYEYLNYIKLKPLNFCNINDCHNNVNYFINNINNTANKILGYYIIFDNILNNFIAIQHSVLLINNKIIDITPSEYDKLLFIYGYKLKEYKTIVYNVDIKKYQYEETTVNNIDGYFL